MTALKLKRSELSTERKSPFDWVLFLAMVVLISFGILTIYSTSFSEQSLSDLFQRQLLFALVGGVLFFFATRIDYKILAQTSALLYIAVLLLLVGTFVWGITTRGSTRWVDLGWFRLQPSEIIKPILIAVLALYYSTRDKLKFKDFLIGLTLAAVPAALVFRQPDLGSALVIMGIWLVMTLVTGMPYRYLLLWVVGVGAIFPIFFEVLKDYQKQRLLTFLNPSADPLGTGYNIIQAIIAVGSGQIIGRGFGRGTQSHLNFLPEQQTDFIFATLAEELGFLGSALVLGLFLVLIIRLLLIAKSSPDQFSMLLVTGIVSMILIQLFINIGMNIGILPVTGITLPFISYGGSSLVAMMISLGLAQSVARARQAPVLQIR